MMSISIIALLIALGLLLILLEILVIPGIGAVGAIGGLLIIWAIYQAYILNDQTGNITVLVSIISASLTIYFSLKSSTWKKAKLNAQITAKIQPEGINHLRIGDKGITLSRLANFGKVNINGQIFEVESQQGFIDVNTSVRVTKIETHKIYVMQDA